LSKNKQVLYEERVELDRFSETTTQSTVLILLRLQMLMCDILKLLDKTRQ